MPEEAGHALRTLSQLASRDIGPASAMRIAYVSGGWSVMSRSDEYVESRELVPRGRLRILLETVAKCSNGRLTRLSNSSRSTGSPSILCFWFKYHHPERA